jgi:hypothetical protein
VTLKSIKINKTVAIVTLIIVVLAVIIALNLDLSKLAEKTKPVAETKTSAPKVNPGLDELPKDADFKKVADTDSLSLYLDSKTGHFKVEDKRNGNVWRSYPDPDQWLDEQQSGVWRTHLRSPVMFQYIDLSGNKSQPKESNLLEENGKITDIKTIPGGFQLTFDMPSKGFTIPVEVKVDNDSVVTKIIDSGVKEKNLSLIWVRVYPFFAAEHSVGQDGYMFIPDGSGALINYNGNNLNMNRIYREPTYGQDLSFKINSADAFSRNKVVMPVFGAKSGDKAYISVMEDGAEFGEIVASPAGVYSGYNWITAQADYRSSYFQVTNEKKNTGFTTYNKDKRFGSDRAVRYILLDKNKADYVGMAERYRQYLMQKYNLKKVQPKDGKIPMTVALVGADSEQGTFNDRYLKETTTSDAMQIVQRLYGLGIQNMIVQYLGWQNDGYSSYGGLFPVDRRLGGNDGMKQFINFAHTLGVPVYLHADYSMNNTGDDGFNDRHFGMRNMGGTIIQDMVSLKWVENIIDRDIKQYKDLGVDGIMLEGIGTFLNSDFNTKYGSPRDESRQVQEDIFKKFKEQFGHVEGVDSNFYTVPYVDQINDLIDDYSYDLFSSEAVPFAQIVLHGLVPYTSQYANDRQQYTNDFLHDLEYGANPSFIFTKGDPTDFKYAQTLHLFSPNFDDWETQAVEEYQKFNEALGDVQDQFIVNHRSLTDKVKETTYANGKKIIVNYGLTPYTDGTITVKPQDYLVIKGGK